MQIEPTIPTPQGRPLANDPLKAQAVELEAFLFAEMLRVSGTGVPSPTGASDSQFDSFLRREQALAVSRSGQTGLAEAIYRALRDAAGEAAAR